MDTIEILGFIAAILTTGAYVPQVYKMWKLKSAKSISITMYTAMLSGVILWIVYGISYNSFPIIIANTITAILISFVIVLKFKYK